MIQVASYEQALIKRNWKLIHNHQSKKCFSSKHRHRNLSLTDIDLEHMVSYQGMQSGLPVFLNGEFGTIEIFLQN